ncbi:MAG: hypothetical protein JNM68_14210 [Dinghuibacter sp.]|nr:hypothetical protein [Dinghuibacter sp.]
MKSSYLPLLIALVFSVSACRKNETNTEDDPMVRVGNQAFCAFKNDKPWVANYSDAGNGVAPIDVAMLDPFLPGLIPHYNYMWVTGKKAGERIELYIPPPLIPGRVLLNRNTFPHPAIGYPPAYGMYYVYNPEKRYMTTENITGFVDIISADTVRRTIEARFEFEAVNNTTGEKVKISNGYFKK